MKHQVVAMRKHSGIINFEDIEFQIGLPKGCTGILLCFESKKTAREHWGKKTGLMRIDNEMDD